MLAFPNMLIGPSEKAGMKVPPDADKFDPNEYPHFQVYLNCQLGAALPFPAAYWQNAEIVAAVPKDKIKTITYTELLEQGFSVGYPMP